LIDEHKTILILYQVQMIFLSEKLIYLPSLKLNGIGQEPITPSYFVIIKII